jgi:hypothetical protein
MHVKFRMDKVPSVEFSDLGIISPEKWESFRKTGILRVHSDEIKMYIQMAVEENKTIFDNKDKYTYDKETNRGYYDWTNCVRCSKKHDVCQEVVILDMKDVEQSRLYSYMKTIGIVVHAMLDDSDSKLLFRAAHWQYHPDNMKNTGSIFPLHYDRSHIAITWQGSPGFHDEHGNKIYWDDSVLVTLGTRSIDFGCTPFKNGVDCSRDVVRRSGGVFIDTVDS